MPEKDLKELLNRVKNGPFTHELLEELKETRKRSAGKIDTPVFVELIEAESKVHDMIVYNKCDAPLREILFGQQDEDGDLRKW